MQKAKSYLNHVEYKVADVAEMVGYKEAKYFSSAFKKSIWDHTPGVSEQASEPFDLV